MDLSAVFDALFSPESELRVRQGAERRIDEVRWLLSDFILHSPAQPNP